MQQRKNNNIKKKKCTYCEKVLNIKYFYRQKKNGKYYRNECIICGRIRLSNITDKETFRKLFLSKRITCMLCNKKEYRKNTTRLSIDHYHKTGKIRGLLCNQCNVGLGAFKDNIKLLKKAIIYLNNNRYLKS